MEVVSYNSYAGFTRRFIAFFLDYICVRVLLLGVIGYATDIDMFEFGNLYSIHTLWVELITMAYFVICESSSWQGTLGKRVFGMKVVTESYLRLAPSQALIRYLSKYLSSFVFALGYIWIIFDAKKQGWHDKIAHTYVIAG
jgi:uncharacterized RDD family membrane protein YckC